MSSAGIESPLPQLKKPETSRLFLSSYRLDDLPASGVSGLSVLALRRKMTLMEWDKPVLRPGRRHIPSG